MRTRWRKPWTLALAVPVLTAGVVACGASASTLVNAGLNTAVGATVAKVRRNRGDCYTWCAEGTTCDRSSGNCVPIPCRGMCGISERCLRQGLNERCVPTVGGDTAALPPPAGQPLPDGGAPPARPPWLP